MQSLYSQIRTVTSGEVSAGYAYCFIWVPKGIRLKMVTLANFTTPFTRISAQISDTLTTPVPNGKPALFQAHQAGIVPKCVLMDIPITNNGYVVGVLQDIATGDEIAMVIGYE